MPQSEELRRLVGEQNPFLRQCQLQLGHKLPLSAYLLKPVQRILKYHLLLQNIVKHCDTTNTDGYSDIIVALSAMTGIAHHINDMKRKHEHKVRVQEVQSLLDSWPVKMPISDPFLI